MSKTYWTQKMRLRPWKLVIQLGWEWPGWEVFLEYFIGLLIIFWSVAWFGGWL